MGNKTDVKSDGERSSEDGSGAVEDAEKKDQAIQINENTVADPQPPEPDPGDDHLHRRSDVGDQDQAIQINENTIADQS